MTAHIQLTRVVSVIKKNGKIMILWFWVAADVASDAKRRALPAQFSVLAPQFFGYFKHTAWAEAMCYSPIETHA